MRLLLLVLLAMLLPLSTKADTIVPGIILSDTTWSPAGGVYVIDSSFSVLAGVTLTIEPGTIIKAKTTALGGPSIYGQLIAHGTSDLPIYFTSIYDDSIGGDTGIDGPTSGAAKDWQGLYFKNGSTDSLDHAIVRYAGQGGFGFGDYLGIENEGGNVTIKNSLIDHNNQHGIWQKAGTLNLENTIISNHFFGLTIWGGTVTASSNTFSSNSEYGLHSPGEGPLSLVNNDFTGNGRTAYVTAAADFTHSDNTSTDIANRGIETGGEARNGAIWHSSDLPFIVNGLTVGPGKTFTLSPGTVLKMNPGAYLDVRGSLISNSTASAPVYFTSLKDDSILGDTNGDGIASLPNLTDWNGISFYESSVGNISHSLIKYSGGFNGTDRSAIFNLGGSLLLDNIKFSNNFQYDIYQNTGSSTISYSTFSTNTNLALLNTSDSNLDARMNWWGTNTGPTHSTNATGTGQAISDNVLYRPWLNFDPTLESPPEQTIDPVIIIPGIMGSAYKNGELIIDPILHTYDDLIATLIANGYVEGVDLFTFPYEWRDSNVFSANLLDDKIDEVKSVCDCDKVDIVAHSMGGLVARSYVQSADYDADVDQLIFLGVPHNGAPTDYLQWEAGKFSPDFGSSFREAFFIVESLQNGYSTIFDYIRSRPILSVQELLPVFNYLKDNSTGVIRTYPNNYPQNFFLESLNNNIPSLLNSGVEITNFVGDSGENKTINMIRVIPTDHTVFWQHGEPEGFGAIIGDSGLERGGGDNTITILSSSLNGVITNEVSASHDRLPTVAENKIINILTGNNSISNIDNGSNIDAKVLLLQLLSPIDLVVTAPDGKKIGKNFLNSTEYDEIPLAFYSGFETDDEYITILNPLNGEYKIEVQGTDNGGAYELLTSYVSEEFATTTETVGITEPNQITNLEVVINNQNPVDLKVERQITLGVLINDIEGAYDLGWIKDKKTRDKFIGKVQKMEKKDKKVDKNLAKLLKATLKAYRKEKINEQAYDIIKGDLEWLINN